MEHYVIINEWARLGNREVEVKAICHSSDEAKVAFEDIKHEELDFISYEDLEVIISSEDHLLATSDSGTFTDLYIICVGG